MIWLIEEVIPGNDWIVRKVSVRTTNGVLSWHVRQLCLLEGQIEQSSSRPDPGGGVLITLEIRLNIYSKFNIKHAI